MIFLKSTRWPQSCHVVRQLYLSASKSRLDYYKILGLSRNATAHEIKKAYLQKCKEYHPDKHMGSKSMQEKFVEANRAYNVLSDTAKKQEYDAKFKTVNQESKYQSHSPYRWGKENRDSRSSPEDVYREYQRHASRHRFRGRYRDSSQDPFYRHWQSVYENPHSTRDKGPFSRPRQDAFQSSGLENDFHDENSDMNVNIKYLVLIFFGFLLLILYVRIKIASKSMHNNVPDYNYKKFHQRQSDIDDLDIKTEDV